MNRTDGTPLTSAVIGLGWWGRHIVTALADSEVVRVTHAVDPDPGAASFAEARGLSLSPSLEVVLDDPTIDAVILVTPHAFHEAQALAVIGAGKELFCEKPLALTASGAGRIIAGCRAAGRILGIGHERRFEPAMEELARAVASGGLGRLLHLEANVSHDILARLDSANWRVSTAHSPAGAMTAVGIHLSDLFIALAGQPKSVRATERGAAGRPAHTLCVEIDYENGVSGRITCLSATPYYGRLTAFGTAGWIEVREGGNVDQGLPSGLVTADAAGRQTERSLPAAATVRANIESWARATRKQGSYRFPLEQILDNVRVLEAVVMSAAQDGRPVLL